MREELSGQWWWQLQQKRERTVCFAGEYLLVNEWCVCATDRATDQALATAQPKCLAHSSPESVCVVKRAPGNSGARCATTNMRSYIESGFSALELIENPTQFVAKE